MIEDLLVINGTGQALYGWHNESNEESFDDDLISGFLTALNSFASAERGEDIKSLKMRETTILFEKYNELQQNLVFVVTTKDEKMLELLHAVIHDVMETFISKFRGSLDKEFDGDITAYRAFDTELIKVFHSYGLDELEGSIERINQKDNLKAILFLESKGGNIYYIHAQEYIDREKMSFLIPLLVNSSKLLYRNYLKQDVNWIYLNTIEKRVLLLEIRKNIIIVKIYESEIDFNTQSIFKSSSFKSSDKYVKNPQKIIEIFEKVILHEKMQQFFLVDFVGKVFYKKLKKEDHNFDDFIPETISFATASKKTSQEIYNKRLLISAINGVDITTIFMNFNSFALVIIGNAKNFRRFKDIQQLCLDVYREIQNNIN